MPVSNFEDSASTLVVLCSEVPFWLRRSAGWPFCIAAVLTVHQMQFSEVAITSSDVGSPKDAPLIWYLLSLEAFMSGSS